jgi:hypothetical protein
MRFRRLFFLAGFITLILAEMACTINIGGSVYPSQSIPVSTEAIGDLQSALETAIANGAISGQVTLNITESQLSSYLSYKLRFQAQPVFTNPQVYLQDGELQIIGTATRGYFQTTVKIVFRAGVDEQGQLKIELISADFGPLPVPNGLLELATTTIQDAYTGAIGPLATGFRLLNVTIAEGSMTIVGQTK